MDVIHGILGEKEFLYFTKEDFDAFVKVLDDTVANMVIKYTEDSAADQNVVNHINDHIGDVLRIRTLHKRLQEKGVPQMLKTISPETILTAEVDIDEVYNNLKDLESVSDDIMSFMPARKKSDFELFKKHIDMVLSRIIANHERPTYPEIPARIKANSFLFYKPNDRGSGTGVGIINATKSAWRQCLRGIEWDRYCRSHSISPIVRRAF